MWVSGIPILPWAFALVAIGVGCMAKASLTDSKGWKETLIVLAIAAVPIGIALSMTIHAIGCVSCQMASQL
jgi:hypothetical protein